MSECQQPHGVAVESDLEAYVVAPACEEWCTWAERHGIDPNEVLVGSYLVRDVENRRVDYLRIIRYGSGAVAFDEFGYVRQAPARSQLEAPPLPFPAGDKP